MMQLSNLLFPPFRELCSVNDLSQRLVRRDVFQVSLRLLGRQRYLKLSSLGRSAASYLAHVSNEG